MHVEPLLVVGPSEGIVRLRPVAHEQEARDGQQRGGPADRHEGVPPADLLHQQRQRGGAREGPERAHTLRRAGHGGELVGAEPLRGQPERGDQHHRGAQAHQQAPGEGHTEGGGQAEQDGAAAHGEPAQGQGAARPEDVGQAAARQPHRREAVGIDGGERAERGGGDHEGGHEVARHHHRRDPVEIGEEVEEGRHEQDRPARPPH